MPPDLPGNLLSRNRIQKKLKLPWKLNATTATFRVRLQSTSSLRANHWWAKSPPANRQPYRVTLVAHGKRRTCPINACHIILQLPPIIKLLKWARRRWIRPCGTYSSLTKCYCWLHKRHVCHHEHSSATNRWRFSYKLRHEVSVMSVAFLLSVSRHRTTSLRSAYNENASYLRKKNKNRRTARSMGGVTLTSCNNLELSGRRLTLRVRFCTSRDSHGSRQNEAWSWSGVLRGGEHLVHSQHRKVLFILSPGCLSSYTCVTTTIQNTGSANLLSSVICNKARYLQCS